MTFFKSELMIRSNKNICIAIHYTHTDRQCAHSNYTVPTHRQDMYSFQLHCTHTQTGNVLIPTTLYTHIDRQCTHSNYITHTQTRNVLIPTTLHTHRHAMYLFQLHCMHSNYITHTQTGNVLIPTTLYPHIDSRQCTHSNYTVHTHRQAMYSFQPQYTHIDRQCTHSNYITHTQTRNVLIPTTLHTQTGNVLIPTTLYTHRQALYSYRLHHARTLYSFPPSPLLPSITPSLFLSMLKTHVFHKSFPP